MSGRGINLSFSQILDSDFNSYNMKYRSRTEIVRSILDAANKSQGTSRTRLMNKSYISFNQLREYLRALQENGLMDYEVGKRGYRMTEKGRRLLQLQNKMEQIAPINYVLSCHVHVLWPFVQP